MATFWRYVKIQAAVFVCGIVGPIFLAIYFGSQPNTTMRWAYWAGLFITTADILIALALTNASDPNETPADTRLAIAVAKRVQSRGGHTSDTSSSSYDPFSSTAFSFSSTDSGSSSSDYSSSSDSGSPSSDHSSSSDSGSSSSSD